MSWSEHDHPRWPAGSGDKAGEFRDAGSPESWLEQVAGQFGRMSHAQLKTYVDRTDYTEEQLHGGNSAYTTLRTYSDGRQLVAKNHDDGEYSEGEDGADIEVQASYVGWAAGAPVPAVVYGDEAGLTLSEYIPSRSGGQYLLDAMGGGFSELAINVWEFMRREAEAVRSLPGSTELGIFDLLIGNEDRHSSNWLVDRNGHAWGIDHANGSIGFNSSTSVFAQQLYNDRGQLTEAVTTAKLEQIGARLQSLHRQQIVTDREYAGMVLILEGLADGIRLRDKL